MQRERLQASRATARQKESTDKKDLQDKEVQSCSFCAINFHHSAVGMSNQEVYESHGIWYSSVRTVSDTRGCRAEQMHTTVD